MAKKKKDYFLKAWSVNQETVEIVERAADILKAESKSYALRQLVEKGYEQLKQQGA